MEQSHAKQPILKRAKKRGSKSTFFITCHFIRLESGTSTQCHEFSQCATRNRKLKLSAHVELTLEIKSEIITMHKHNKVH